MKKVDSVSDSEPAISRVLIWGKTYPELSWGHNETVCTGGSLENGRPVRIYPVPLRYLPRQQQYKLYSWVELPLVSSTRDRRPESRKLDRIDVTVSGHLGTERGWYERRRVIFRDRSWHYSCLAHLKVAQKREKRSLGFLKVREVERVRSVARKPEDRKAHEKKLVELQSRIDMFRDPVKGLEFFPWDVRVEWRCVDDVCPGHTAKVMDWGLGELGRREGIEVAQARMEELANLDRYDLHIYAGNIKNHPTSFSIVGLWYPMKREVEKYPLQEDFFM